jgi:hypothetical protein
LDIGQCQLDARRILQLADQIIQHLALFDGYIDVHNIPIDKIDRGQKIANKELNLQINYAEDNVSI